MLVCAGQYGPLMDDEEDEEGLDDFLPENEVDDEVFAENGTFLLDTESVALVMLAEWRGIVLVFFFIFLLTCLKISNPELNLLLLIL